MARASAILAALLLLTVPAVEAQTAKAALPTSIAAHPDWPKANPADVQSVDAILAALYDVISGPAGQPRDWNRFRSLFIPDARLIPTRHSKTGPGADVLPLTVEQYQQLAGPGLAKGFFEHGIHNTTESFGDIVHVFSTYESRKTKDGQPFARGINSIQLLKDGNRYWVVTILWDEETPTTPLPAKYLP
ncbi:MAG TPA: hypothetical protein VGM02_03060 [Acidobacteriaceae bacterium]|jgi:hypothetical protein